MADDFSFQIIEELGSISESKAGWKTELNIVSWGGRPGKYDLRSWSPDKQKMGKGITFTKEELIALKNLLNSLELNI
ncbi:MAG: hypothetical protein IJZ27_04935 [Treponema sp.]|jgi:hypothetical protein|nr:hypothetical protein [Treponema bryantii]MBQ8211855.1 hypothetical protein [Treponema sp.]MBR2105927.1 hypothetical protein [Treponema sp.]MBR6584015.1 hypothetical protein [Treponema sp.]